jgi:hypothetical protein
MRAAKQTRCARLTLGNLAGNGEEQIGRSTHPASLAVRAPFTHSHLPRHARVQHVPAFPALCPHNAAPHIMLLPLLENEKKKLCRAREANSRRLKVGVRVHRLVRQSAPGSIMAKVTSCNDCRPMRWKNYAAFLIGSFLYYLNANASAALCNLFFFQQVDNPYIEA